MEGITRQEHVKREKMIVNMLKRLEEKEHNTTELVKLETAIVNQYQEYQKLLDKLSIYIYNYKELCVAIDREYRQSMRNSNKLSRKNRNGNEEQNSSKGLLAAVV